MRVKRTSWERYAVSRVTFFILYTYEERRPDTEEGLPSDAGDRVAEKEDGCSEGSSRVDELK